MSHRVKKWSQVDWVESVGKGKALRRKGKKRGLKNEKKRKQKANVDTGNRYIGKDKESTEGT